MANRDIDSFFRGLSYDPRIVLSVVQDGDTTSVPVTTPKKGNNEVVVCRTIKHTLNKNLSDFAILSQGAVAFPGALLVADNHLQSGAPTPIGLRRKKVMLTVDLPGLTNPSGEADPTTSGIQTFLNSKLEEWNRLSESQGYRNAVRSMLNFSTAYSRQQVAVNLGFKAEWASGDASAQLDVSSSTERSVVVCYYKQVFYTVKMNTPASPADVFDPSVSLADVRSVASTGGPPAYVDSVDYGRILLVKMETSSVDTSVNLQGAFKQATLGGVTVSGDLKTKYDQIIKDATFTAVAIGGGTSEAARIFIGASAGEPQGLKEYFDAGCYTRNNPGMPIAYVVRFLKDNALATIGTTTNYTELECTRYRNSYIKVVHHGGYVAKFYWRWTDMDAHGEYTVEGGVDSGEVTRGWSKTVSIPGTARNVRLKGLAMTAVIGQNWQEIGDIHNPKLNKTYTAVGTTLIGRAFE